MYRKAAVLKADVHMFDFRRTSFRNVTDLVSESVQKWELLQLSGCSVHSSEIHFQEVLKIEELCRIGTLVAVDSEWRNTKLNPRLNGMNGFAVETT